MYCPVLIVMQTMKLSVRLCYCAFNSLFIYAVLIFKNEALHEYTYNICLKNLLLLSIIEIHRGNIPHIISIQHPLSSSSFTITHATQSRCFQRSHLYSTCCLAHIQIITRASQSMLCKNRSSITHCIKGGAHCLPKTRSNAVSQQQ